MSVKMLIVVFWGDMLSCWWFLKFWGNECRRPQSTAVCIIFHIIRLCYLGVFLACVPVFHIILLILYFCNSSHTVLSVFTQWFK